MVDYQKLADKLAHDEGYENFSHMIATSNVFLDSCQPGICTACESTSFPHEPDASTNYCELCGQNKVISAMELIFRGAD